MRRKTNINVTVVPPLSRHLPEGSWRDNLIERVLLLALWLIRPVKAYYFLAIRGRDSLQGLVARQDH
jgi:hypothetical protein